MNEFLLNVKKYIEDELIDHPMDNIKLDENTIIFHSYYGTLRITYEENECPHLYGHWKNIEINSEITTKIFKSFLLNFMKQCDEIIKRDLQNYYRIVILSNNKMSCGFSLTHPDKRFLKPTEQILKMDFSEENLDTLKNMSVHLTNLKLTI